MAKPPDVRIILALPPALFAEVIAHRAAKRLPSRTEAIRRLLRVGLDTARAEKPDD